MTRSQRNQERAWELFREALELQMSGDLEGAIRRYKLSIQACPTAEAHTFLGWTYGHQGRFHEAIEECKRAIMIDPDFGNPYNDIGAYLIELGRLEEAIPWLERATEARRYDSYHFPYFNLGRIYAAKEMYNRALECFAKALEHEPEYHLAREAMEAIRRRLQ